MCILGCSSRSIYKAHSYGQLNLIPPQSYYMIIMIISQLPSSMYTIIINGYLILFFAFISALFSSRFKYYYDLDVNLIRCSADVKAKNSTIRNLMMMTRDVIRHSDWIEERILCCEMMVRYLQMMMIPIMMIMIIKNYTLLIISY